MIRGRRAHGAALATLPTCAHLSEQARLHRAGSVPCKPKTLKMSAYGCFSPTARPPRVLPTPWALPTRVRHVAGGAGKPPAPLPQNVGSPQPVKGQAATRFFLDGFPARPLRLVLLPPTEMERGSRGDEVVHFTLDALESTTLTVGRGRWIGFATCPGLGQVEVGFGRQSPSLFFVLKLLGWM